MPPPPPDTDDESAEGSRAEGHSVLVIPVPALEPLVRARHVHYDPEWVSSDPRFPHAHLTVLGPFVPRPGLTEEITRTIGALAAGVETFRVQLSHVATFPNGIIHLVPEPLAPLQALTERVCAAFPEYRPYGGLHEPAVPHVTIDATGPGVDEDVVRGWVASLLPSALVVRHLVLSWYQARQCRVLAQWPLARPSDQSRRSLR